VPGQSLDTRASASLLNLDTRAPRLGEIQGLEFGPVRSGWGALRFRQPVMQHINIGLVLVFAAVVGMAIILAAREALGRCVRG